MIISSELTGKIYDTVDECLAAEEEERAKREKEKIEKMKADKEEKAARDAVLEAFDNYCKVIGATKENIEFVALDLITDFAFRGRED